ADRATCRPEIYSGRHILAGILATGHLLCGEVGRCAGPNAGFVMKNCTLAVVLALAAAFSSGASAQNAQSRFLEVENRTIEIFERAAPSVVQIVGRKGPTDVMSTEEKNATTQTGTGFVWDAAGNVVTNNHVVEGTNALAVRLASGEV